MAVGLDPGLGVLHADQKGRDSMVLDLMEPVRPVVDRFILTMLGTRPLRKADVIEDQRGVVRLRAPLTHEIAQAMPEWGRAIGSAIEGVADTFGSASPYEVSVPSVLTRSKHKRVARERVAGAIGEVRQVAVGPNTGGISAAPKARQKPRVSRAKTTVPRCQRCGDRIRAEADRATARGSFCPSCLAERRIEVGNMIQAMPKERRSVSPLATAKRSQANEVERLERQRWELEHEGEVFDREWFVAEVLPKLQGLSLTTIAKATGISTSAASKVRSGKRVPHPRHWARLAAIAHDSPSPAPAPESAIPDTLGEKRGQALGGEHGT